MTFLEWVGSIALTVFITWAMLVLGLMIGAFQRADMEGLATGLIGAQIGGVTGFLLSLWLVWGIDLFPFIGD